MKYRDLREAPDAEGSDVIRERVIRTRRRQLERYQGGENLFQCADESPAASQVLQPFSRMRALARERNEPIGPERARPRPNPQVSRTIADMEGSEDIGVTHISEAIQYRSLDRNYWM